MSENARIHAIILGRVQGVGFRFHTLQEAKRLGLTGWVKNLPDGSVELVAEGPRTQLEKFEKWAHRGPRSAEVTEINLRHLPYLGDLSDFKISRED